MQTATSIPTIGIEAEDGVVLITSGCSDRTGHERYLVRQLQILGRPGPQYDRDLASFRRTIGELYVTAAQFDILFSDYAKGEPEVFVTQFIDPRSAWFSVETMEGDQVGIMALSEINPYWDALAHIAFWDSVLPGREPIAWDMIEWAMDKFHLPRLSAEVPQYQKHFNRHIARLGFKLEGVKRQAGLRKGHRVDMNFYSILPEEVKEARDGFKH